MLSDSIGILEFWGGEKKESDSLVISQIFLLFYTSLQDIIIELFKTISKSKTNND